MIDVLMADGGSWFTVPAIAGTAYFALQLAAGQLGGDGDLDVDLNADADFDAGLGDGDAPAHDVQVLSLQTLSAFFAGSGWMGLASLRLTDFGFAGAAVIAVLSGVAIAWLLISILRQLFKLQSSGNISIGSAVGLTGDVVVAVPGANEGSGRVSVVVAKRRREFSAVQEGASPIGSRTRVRVVRADAETNTVTVAPA